MPSFLHSVAVSIAAALSPCSQQADLVFAGDAMQHSAQLEAARTSEGRYEYSDCFSVVKPYVESADYAVVNLETPLGGKPYSGYPCFCAPDSYAEALKDAGFDMFLTANNHTLDRRDRGLRRTISVLDSLGVDHLGTYAHDSVRARVIPMIKDVNGFKIGFLNYTYGTNGFMPGNGTVVDYIDTLSIKRDISDARSAGAEMLVVAIHWGDEYVLLPNKAQKRVGEFLLSQGVDMIIGGHPHVIQPMELRRCDSDSTRNRLIVYSLGNFISNMKTRDTRGGVMLKVRLKRNVLGKPYIESACYKPVFTMPPSRGRNYRLVDAATPCDDPAWDFHRRDFLKSATAVFDKHNLNVPADTVLLK